MKLSVLSVAYPLAPVRPDSTGGAEQVLGAIDRGLTARGHESIVVACAGSSVTGTLVETPRVEGLLDSAARAEAQRHTRAAIEYAMARWSIDVIHMHGVDFYACLPPVPMPVMATLHLPPSWYPPEVFDLDVHLNCVSRNQQDACPKPVLCIENGVEIKPARVSRRGFALAMGRVCPEKGFHLALDAAAEAGVPLLLAGQVYRYPEHEQYFAEEIQPRLNGSTRRFIGAIAGVRKRRLLTAARCLLIPSLAPETSSLVAMEAIACGTPVIAFPAGALGEIVEHGRSGFLVKNAREMAEAIALAPRLRLAPSRRFAAQTMVAKYLDRYETLTQCYKSPSTVHSRA